MNRGHTRLNLGSMQIGAHKRPFKLPVDFVCCGVAIGIRAGPAVVLNGGVERLRSIADVVSQPPGIEDGSLFYRVRVLVCGRKPPILPQRRLESLPGRGGLPGLKADLFRTLTGSERLHLEISPPAWQPTDAIGRATLE